VVTDEIPLAQGDRAVVLAQQVGEGLVGQLLQGFHAVSAQELEGVPSLRVELDQLAARDGTRRGINPLSTTVVHDT